MKCAGIHIAHRYTVSPQTALREERSYRDMSLIYCLSLTVVFLLFMFNYGFAQKHTVTVADEMLVNKSNISETSVIEYDDIEQPSDTSARKPFYMDVKTNLLYDALVIPSIGVDFYLGKNWTAGINWMYGWWKSDPGHRYWRAYGGDLNVRRWFGSKAAGKPLTGHHVGLYAGIVTYDFEFGGKGYMGGRPKGTLWDRCNFFCGVEYGYTLPIAKRLNLDFTIGIGYLGGEYMEYKPSGNHYIWESTKRLNWFGPTKAEVSLVWLIGHDNINKSKKGGEL